MNTEKLKALVAAKERLDAAQSVFDNLRLEVTKETEFPIGSKTAHHTFDCFKITIQLRENVSWDQEKIAKVKEHFPEQFPQFFKAEYKPVAAKALEFAPPEMQKAIDWAKIVKPGTPGITISEAKKEGEANA